MLVCCIETLPNIDADETARNPPGQNKENILPPGVTRGTEIDLLKPPLSDTWAEFSTRKQEAEPTWRIVENGSDRVLICSGQPKGYLYTKKEFTNFELNFQWQYPDDPNGNSGVLVYTKYEPRLWPTSMQVQLHAPQAGAIFASGDATSDRPFDGGLKAKSGEWNQCRIVSYHGRLFVEINGQKAGRAEGCSPATGHIGLQSEGSVTHFRRMKLTILTSEQTEKPRSAENAGPQPSDPAAPTP